MLQKGKMVSRIAVYCSMLFVGMGTIGAQENQQNAENGDSRPEQQESAGIVSNEGSYLDHFYARKNASRLLEKQKQKLRILRVMVENFGNTEQKTTFEKTNQNFKDSYKLFKRTKHLAAERALRDNESNFKQLFSQLAKEYQARTSDLLGRCADQLVEYELGERQVEKENPREQARLLDGLTVQLDVAYRKLAAGERFAAKGRAFDAIQQYRLARYYAVHMLANLAKDEEQKKQILDKYKKDLADINNKVASQENANMPQG